MCREVAGLLPSTGGLTGFVGMVLHGTTKVEDGSLLRAVSTHCKSIPLGAQGLVGTSVWPAQYGSGLSWRSLWQAAPTMVCTVKHVPYEGAASQRPTSNTYVHTLFFLLFSFPPLPQGVL